MGHSLSGGAPTTDPPLRPQPENYRRPFQKIHLISVTAALCRFSRIFAFPFLSIPARSYGVPLLSACVCVCDSHHCSMSLLSQHSHPSQPKSIPIGFRTHGLLRLMAALPTHTFSPCSPVAMDLRLGNAQNDDPPWRLSLAQEKKMAFFRHHP